MMVKKKIKQKIKKKSLKGRLAPITMILINCEWKKKDIALYVKKKPIYISTALQICLSYENE